MSITPLSDLPKREAELFRVLCDHYEKQAWSKAFKTAEEILHSFPNNPETLAMKGLTTYAAPPNEGGDKEKGFQLIKLALLKSGFKSMICWHTYGLYYRAEHNYTEAVKCYKKALEITPDNIQILRDLGTLQMHIRDYDGIVKTRQAVLKQRPQMNMHWVQLAVAAHVAGDQKLAEDTLDKAIERVRDDRKSFMEENKSAAFDKKKSALQGIQNSWLQTRHELGELIMFRAQMIEEDGKYDDCIKFLNDNASDIADKLGMRAMTAEVLLKAKKYEDAAKAYEILLRINCDNADYHQGYLEAKLAGADIAASYDKVKAHCDAILEKYVGSRLTQAFCLKLLKGDDYTKLFEKMLIENIRRGVPSMYQVLKQTLNSPEKVEAVRALLNRLLESLSKHGTFTSADPEKDGEREAPSVTLWMTLFAAQFFSRHGEVARARDLVLAAEKHTPTAIEVYMAKAKVLAQCGDFVAASEAFEHARKMDLADRYVNNKSTKYLLRVNKPETATATISMFLKGEGNTYPHVVLAATQVSWFEWELGQCYERMGEVAKALKRYAAICNQFQTHVQETFDYHYYSFRKNTVRAYEQLLHFSETLPERKMYLRSTLRAVEMYMKIAAMRAADPKLVDEAKSAREALAKADAEENLRKQKEKEKDREKEVEKDSDPLGLRLFSVEDPLAEAQKLMNEMLTNTRNPRVPLHMPAEVYSTAARLALVRGKHADALALVRKGAEIDATDATVIRAALMVLNEAPAGLDGLDALRTEVLHVEAGADALQHALDAADKLCGYVSILRAAEKILKPEKMPSVGNEYVKKLISLATPASCLCSLRCAARFVQESPLFDESAKKQFIDHCKALYPNGTVFDIIVNPKQEDVIDPPPAEKKP